jgi:hypothetical protein
VLVEHHSGNGQGGHQLEFNSSDPVAAGMRASL